MNVLFGSQVIQRPGVYTNVNPQGTAVITAGAPSVVALVGQSNGTPPNVPQTWSSPLQTSALRGGELQDGVNFTWNPSGTAGGASEVITVRVGEPTQASASLLDSTGNKTILLNSVDYGSWTNGIQYAVSSGAASTERIVTLQYTPDNFKLVSPSLGEAMTIEYTGNGTSSTVTLTTSLSAPSTPTLTAGTGGSLTSGTTVYAVVTATNASGESLPSTAATLTIATASGSAVVSGTAVAGATGYNVYAGTTSGQLYYADTSTKVSFTLDTIPTSGAVPPTVNTTGPDIVATVSGQTDASTGFDLSLSVAPYTTLQGLSNAINAFSGFTTSVVGVPSMPSSYLDPLASTSDMGAAVDLTAQQGSIVYWINTNNNYITATAVSGNTNPPALTNGLLRLAGGSNGPTPTVQDWQNALTAVVGTVADIIVPLTSDTAIQSLFEATNQSRASNGQGFTVGVYGGALGETPIQTMQRAQAFNSDRAMLAAPGFYQYNYLGAYTEFPPYMLAAMYAGIIAGQAVTTPITYKEPNVLALEQTYSFAQINQFIATGVAVTVPIRSGGFRIEQGVSTSVSGTTLYQTEFSVLRSVDYVRESLALAFLAYVGTASQGGATIAQLTSTATKVLNSMVSNGVISAFDPVSGIVQPATNPTVYKVPTNIYVRDPINNVLVTVNLAA